MSGQASTGGAADHQPGCARPTITASLSCSRKSASKRGQSKRKMLAAAGANYMLPTISGRGGRMHRRYLDSDQHRNAPDARGHHTAVWTGSEMIVWGGFGGTYLNTGGRSNPSTDSWIGTSTLTRPRLAGTQQLDRQRNDRLGRR